MAVAIIWCENEFHYLFNKLNNRYIYKNQFTTKNLTP